MLFDGVSGYGIDEKGDKLIFLDEVQHSYLVPHDGCSDFSR